MSETNLRQAEASVEVEGILSENNLELISKDDGNDVIRGNIIVQTSETNFVTLNAYTSKITAKKKENPSFKSLIKVADYPSIAKAGAEEATKVLIKRGQVAPETYFNNNGKNEIVKHKVSFAETSNANSYEPRAKFAIEIFIQSIMEEADLEGIPTGRVIVKGYMPTYNGIEPIEVVAPVEDGIADAVNSTFEPGQTVRFTGDVVNNQIVKITEIPVAIGKPQIKKETTYKNELVVEGASAPYEEGITPFPPYEAEVIKKALVERETMLQAKEAEAKSGKKTNVSKGATQGGRATAATSRALPF